MNVETLDTTCSIFKAKRAKIQRAKSILARTRNIITIAFVFLINFIFFFVNIYIFICCRNFYI